MKSKCEIRQVICHWYIYIDGKSYGFGVYNHKFGVLAIFEKKILNKINKFKVNKKDYLGNNYDKVILTFYADKEEIHKIFNKEIKEIYFDAFEYNCRHYLYDSVKHLLTKEERIKLKNEIKLNIKESLFLYIRFYNYKYRVYIIIILFTLLLLNEISSK